MLLAEAGQASAIGWFTISATAVVGLVSVVLAIFATRREVEAKTADHERRIAEMERREGPSGQTFLDHSRRNADAHQVIERQIAEADRTSRQLLTDAINTVNREVAALSRNVAVVESETRVQTRTINAIARRMNIVPEQRDEA